MGLIFWIDENTFATNLVERALKAQGIDFYTVNQAKDFSYLIHDLKPQIVVIDALTAEKDLAAFKEQCQASDNFLGARIVVIGEPGELAFLGEMSILHRPLDPFQLKQYFSNI